MASFDQFMQALRANPGEFQAISQDGGPPVVALVADGSIVQQFPMSDVSAYRYPDGFSATYSSDDGRGFAVTDADPRPTLDQLRTSYSRSRLPAAGISFDQYMRETGAQVDASGRVDQTISKDWGFGGGSIWDAIVDLAPKALALYGGVTGLESLFGSGLGAGLEAGGAAADMFGQGAQNLANYGAATAGAGGVGNALQAGVFPVSGEVGLDASMFDAGGAGADMFGQGAIDLGNYGAASAGAGSAMLDPSLITSPVAPVSTGAPVPTSVGDPFIDAYTPISSNVPQGTWAPTPGVGTVASAINNLLGTSLTDADVSTGVKVGTTAAGLLAGSGAAGGASTLPGSDTSGLDAAKARTRSSIAGMFEGQDPRYQGIRDSVLGFQKSSLDRDREEAARKLKFSLLRTGNAGGSLQVDEGSKLNRTYDRGLLDATNLADQAAQSARSSDASTKLDLLGRVDSGLDQDAATASAAEQMRLAGDRATSQGLGTTLGNVFADAGLMFQTDAARRGMTDARKAFQSMFSTVPGSSGGSYTGITGRA